MSACASAAPRATSLAASFPSEPSAPGGRPRARAACARCGGPLVRPHERRSRPRSPGARADRRGVAAPGGVDEKVGASGALRVPRVGREVLVGLGLRLAHRAPVDPRQPWSEHPGEPALVGERGERSAPSLAGLTDHHVDRDTRICEEHLVERCVTVHLSQRAHLDAGLVHRQREVADALVLRHVPVGAGEEHAELGMVGRGVPHLLSVDHPLVAVALGSGREAGEVGAVAWLAEELAPHVLTGEDRMEELASQRVGPVGEDRRCRQPHAPADGRTNGAGVRDLVVHDRLGPRREALAEPLDRPRRARPSRVGEPRAPLDERGGRDPSSPRATRGSRHGPSWRRGRVGPSRRTYTVA